MLPIFLLAAHLEHAQPPATRVDFGHKLDQWGDDVSDFFGYGDHPDEVFACSDGVMEVRRGSERSSGHEMWLLRGAVPAPARGYGYYSNFVGVKEGQANFVISFGQHVPPPPIGLNEIRIEEKLDLPPRVGFVRLLMQGLTAQPYEVVCDISRAKEK
ncbi:MAG: hypothetical protein HY053_08735 [Proteobacteria bacterium]|nr:hypothetical protein [Pseudomonadota bacterium]